MRTKLQAARIATGAGCAMAIAVGHVEHPLRALAEGARCTWFLPAAEGRSARKRWIAGALQPGRGPDRRRRSRPGAGRRPLAPPRRRPRRGRRRSSAATRCWSNSRDGTVLARGLSAYASADARRIAGHRSEEIEAILGWRGRDEMVHRDDLTLV